MNFVDLVVRKQLKLINVLNVKTIMIHLKIMPAELIMWYAMIVKINGLVVTIVI